MSKRAISLLNRLHTCMYIPGIKLTATQTAGALLSYNADMEYAVPLWREVLFAIGHREYDDAEKTIVELEAWHNKRRQQNWCS